MDAGVRARETVADGSAPRGSWAWAYVLGEYAAGVATAVATALPIHALVDRDWDMVVAMLAGTVLGSIAHVLVLGVFGPLVGFFHVMAPGALIGMYGGMLFGMRDSMQAASWSQTMAVAAATGFAMVVAMQLYDRAIRSEAEGSRWQQTNP